MDQPSSSSRLRPPFWDHQRHVLVHLRRAIERVLQKHTSPTAGQSLLDFGCGDRPYEPLFRALGWKYIGCDLEGEVDVRAVPGQPLPFPEASADGVGSFQVLEHVWDLDWYLGEAHRALKPGGWLLLSTHGVWLYHPHPTDFRRWTRDGLHREIATRGFVVEAMEGVVGPLAWTTQFRLLGLRHVLRAVPWIGPFLAASVALAMNLRMELEDAITPEGHRQDNACVYVVLARKAVAAPPPA